MGRRGAASIGAPAVGAVRSEVDGFAETYCKLLTLRLFIVPRFAGSGLPDCPRAALACQPRRFLNPLPCDLMAPAAPGTAHRARSPTQ